MAYDFFLADEASFDRGVQIPEWISERHPKMVANINSGEVDYYGTFTRAEIVDALNQYADDYNNMNDYHKNQHQAGIDHLKQSDSNEFKISAIYWTSGEY